MLNHHYFATRVWRPGLEAAGLAGRYRWHDLRHACVSRLIEQGADVAVVQAVCGHSSAATTLGVYAQLRDDRIRRAALTFDPGTVRAPARVGAAKKGNGNAE